MTLSELNDSLSLNGATIAFQIDFGGGNDSVSTSGTTGLTLSMGAGDDTVSGSTATANLDMENGNDVVNLNAMPFPMTSALVLGGAGNDSLRANGFTSVTLEGGVGNDSLTANGYTAATLDGGVGNDTLSSSEADDAFANATLRGGDGDDVITGSSFFGALHVDAGVGNDTLTITARVGTFEGGEGADTLTIEIQALESGDFIVDGGAGNDILNLTQSAPISVFTVRQMTVVGGAGDDDINGSSIDSGMTSETFVFRTGWGNDTISGFDLDASNGDDMLIFRGIAGLDERSDLTVSGDVNHVVLSHGGQSVRLDGIDVANVDDLTIQFFLG